MSTQRSPKVRLDLLDQLALPSFTDDEVRAVAAKWTISSDTRNARSTLTQPFSFEADDVALFEVITEDAAIEDIREALRAEKFEMTGPRKALHVLVHKYFPHRQPFPFACWENDGAAGETVTYVQHDRADQITVHSIGPDDFGPCSEHVFVIARRQRIA